MVDEYYEAGDENAQEAVDKRIRDQVRELIEAEGFTRPPMLFEPYTGKIDLRLFRYLCETGAIENIQTDNSELIRSATELQRIEGWTIAIPASLMGENWTDFCSDRAAKHKQHEDGFMLDTESSAGRPRKRERAAEAYKDLYSSGTRKDSWVKAAYRISQITGESVSVDTLKRGLGKK